MSDFVKCKRCNRRLTSKLSIERGYGDTCYRIIQLQKTELPKVKSDFNQELAFIKCEIKTLKRMFRNIQTNGISINPIEKIKQDNLRTEKDLNKNNMTNVITELKNIMNSVENIHDILKPIEPRSSPEVLEVSQLVLA